MPDIRRILKVTFTPSPDAEPADGEIGIRANNFWFVAIGTNEFLAMTPSNGYGGIESMHEDLNENAVRGTYSVARASEAELLEFERTDGHLHN